MSLPGAGWICGKDLWDLLQAGRVSIWTQFPVWCPESTLLHGHRHSSLMKQFADRNPAWQIFT